MTSKVGLRNWNGTGLRNRVSTSDATTFVGLVGSSNEVRIRFEFGWV